jgi:hypothetical protein
VQKFWTSLGNLLAAHPHKAKIPDLVTNGVFTRLFDEDESLVITSPHIYVLVLAQSFSFGFFATCHSTRKLKTKMSKVMTEHSDEEDTVTVFKKDLDSLVDTVSGLFDLFHRRQGAASCVK